MADKRLLSDNGKVVKNPLFSGPGGNLGLDDFSQPGLLVLQPQKPGNASREDRRSESLPVAPPSGPSSVGNVVGLGNRGPSPHKPLVSAFGVGSDRPPPGPTGGPSPLISSVGPPLGSFGGPPLVSSVGPPPASAVGPPLASSVGPPPSIFTSPHTRGQHSIFANRAKAPSVLSSQPPPTFFNPLLAGPAPTSGPPSVLSSANSTPPAQLQSFFSPSLPGTPQSTSYFSPSPTPPSNLPRASPSTLPPSCPVPEPSVPHPRESSASPGITSSTNIFTPPTSVGLPVGSLPPTGSRRGPSPNSTSQFFTPSVATGPPTSAAASAQPIKGKSASPVAPQLFNPTGLPNVGSAKTVPATSINRGSSGSPVIPGSISTSPPFFNPGPPPGSFPPVLLPGGNSVSAAKSAIFAPPSAGSTTLPPSTNLPTSFFTPSLVAGPPGATRITPPPTNLSGASRTSPIIPGSSVPPSSFFSTPPPTSTLGNFFTSPPLPAPNQSYYFPTEHNNSSVPVAPKEAIPPTNLLNQLAIHKDTSSVPQTGDQKTPAAPKPASVTPTSVNTADANNSSVPPVLTSVPLTTQPNSTFEGSSADSTGEITKSYSAEPDTLPSTPEVSSPLSSAEASPDKESTQASESTQGIDISSTLPPTSGSSELFDQRRGAGEPAAPAPPPSFAPSAPPSVPASLFGQTSENTAASFFAPAPAPGAGPPPTGPVSSPPLGPPPSAPPPNFQGNPSINPYQRIPLKSQRPSLGSLPPVTNLFQPSIPDTGVTPSSGLGLQQSSSAPSAFRPVGVAEPHLFTPIAPPEEAGSESKKCDQDTVPLAQNQFYLPGSASSAVQETKAPSLPTSSQTFESSAGAFVNQPSEPVEAPSGLTSSRSSASSLFASEFPNLSGGFTAIPHHPSPSTSPSVSNHSHSPSPAVLPAEQNILTKPEPGPSKQLPVDHSVPTLEPQQIVLPPRVPSVGPGTLSVGDPVVANPPPRLNSSTDSRPPLPPPPSSSSPAPLVTVPLGPSSVPLVPTYPVLTNSPISLPIPTPPLPATNNLFNDPPPLPGQQFRQIPLDANNPIPLFNPQAVAPVPTQPPAKQGGAVSYRRANLKKPVYAPVPGLDMAAKPQVSTTPEAAPPTPSSPPPIIPPSFNAVSQGQPLYRPVYHHWFHKSRDDKSWQPFSMADSLNLEQAFVSGDLTNETKVATDGGRYDVEVVSRLRKAAYWEESPSEVRRCSWFVKSSPDLIFTPYDENIALLLEDEYKIAFMQSDWGRRVDLGDGEVIVIHGPHAIAHYQRSSTPDPWDNSTGIQMKPRVVKRGLDEFDIAEGEPTQVDHLLLVVHGIGKACDLRFRNLVEVVEDFRSISLQLVQAHFKSGCERGAVGRVEVLPVEWHKALHTEAIDQRLADITLPSIPRAREFTNETLLDILFYTSPVFCERIVQAVGDELNRVYSLYMERNPGFKGGVSLAGHSLGSLILFDMLCHQRPTRHHLPLQHSQTIEEGDEDVPQLGCMKKKAKLSRKMSFITMGPAGTGQPFIVYPQLRFHPKAFFALGSPIGMFVTVRGIETLGEEFRFPTCPSFFNIFHPNDPVAYRIEGLISSNLSSVPPVLIPHHKGRKRMHLELKDTMVHVTAALKQKVVDSFRSTWNQLYQLAMFHKNVDDQKAIEQEVGKVIEDEILRNEALAGSELRNEEPDMDLKVGVLNGGRRIDYVLQEAPLETFNQYISAIRSHLVYWDSEDTILLVMKELYETLGVQADSQAHQQVLPFDISSEEFAEPGTAYSQYTDSPPQSSASLPVIQ